jgi:hypothetical protein
VLALGLSNIAQQNIQTRISIGLRRELLRRSQKSDRRMSCDSLRRYRRGAGGHELRRAGPGLVAIIPVVDNGRGLGFGGPIRKWLGMVQVPPETRALARLLAQYRQPNNARGIFELVITAVPFLSSGL